MGIGRRFDILLGAISFLVLTVISIATYWMGVNNAKMAAEEKGELIFLYQLASLDYFMQKQIPLAMELLEKDRFYPELMSGFAASRLIHENFKTYMPAYEIKYASLNPLRKENAANPEETRIIQEFKAQPNLKQQKGFLTLDNRGRVYFLARPIAVKADCLKCHGSPVDAPKDQVAIYGSTHGYNWQVNDVLSMFIVYIPFEQVLIDARYNAFRIFGLGAAILLVAILIISLTLNKTIIRPIVELSKRAEEISIGEKLDEKIVYSGKDEISELAKSINRLRISINKMQKML